MIVGIGKMKNKVKEVGENKMRILTAQEIYRAYYYDRVKADKKYVPLDELPDELKSKYKVNRDMK